MANEPTISWIAVSKGPPHCPESLRNTNVNISGAKVPVKPAVSIEQNCARNIVKPNAISFPLAIYANMPDTVPIPKP